MPHVIRIPRDMFTKDFILLPLEIREIPVDSQECYGIFWKKYFHFQTILPYHKFIKKFMKNVLAPYKFLYPPPLRPPPRESIGVSVNDKPSINPCSCAKCNELKNAIHGGLGSMPIPATILQLKA